jgi:hypothetical protein
MIYFYVPDDGICDLHPDLQEAIRTGRPPTNEVYGMSGQILVKHYYSQRPQANQAPTAVDDHRHVAADSIALIDVLANDSDADGDVPVLTGISDPSHGRARIVDAGSRIEYIPESGFRGQDRISYRISDTKAGSAEAELMVTVGEGTSTPRRISFLIEQNGAAWPNLMIQRLDPDPDSVITDTSGRASLLQASYALPATFSFQELSPDLDS